MKLLCTDLDRTLLPNGDAPESPLARPVLWHLLRSHEMALAYVSGRDLNRVLQAVSEYELMAPDIIVGDVGTSIYIFSDEGWQLHEGWQMRISADWNGLDSEGIQLTLSSFGELQDQEADRQSRFKRSYYLPQELDVASLEQRLSLHLQEQGVQASLVFSDDPQKGVQLLDVLPRSATKREAMIYIQEMLAIDNDQALFSGDSGNDVTALASHLQSVTVRNADQTTRRAVRELAVKNDTVSSSYQAEGTLKLAAGYELNGNYAAGIVEGLVHFNPSWADWLKSSDWLDSAMARDATEG